MNLRNRKVVLTVRILLGALFVFSGISGLMAGFQGMQGIPEPMVATTQMLWNTGIFQMIKVTEIVAGLMLVFGFLPALAAIFVAPICVGVVIVNARTAPAYIITGLIISVADAFLGYAYWDKYKTLFTK